MLLTVREVAARLKCNTNTVYKLINCGLLTHMKLGSIKVREESLNKFLETYDGKNVDELLEGVK